MYNIQPQSAMTEMYDVGKGEAQVIDLTNAQNAIRQKAAFQHEDEKLRQKAKQDLVNKVSAVDSSLLKPNDISYIAQKQNALRDKLKNKFKNNRELSIEDQLDIENDLAQIKTEAINSADAKKYTQSLLNKVVIEPEGTYDEDDIQNLKDFLSNPSKSGNYDTGSLALNKKFDFGKYVSGTLGPHADRIAGNQPVGNRKTFTKDQADDLIDRSLLDPVNIRAVSKEMELEKKLGKLPADYHDVNEYAKNKYSKELIQDAPMYAPQHNPYTGLGSRAYESQPNTYIDPKTKTMDTYTGTKGEEALVTKTTYQGEPVMATPPQNIKFNDKGDVEGSVMTIKPSPAQMAENSAVRTQNRQNKTNLNAKLVELDLVNPPKKDEGWFGDSDADYKEKLKAYNKEVDALKAQYPIEEEPYPERSVPLSAEETKKHYFETWGVPIEKVLKDKEKTQGMKVHVEPGKKDQTKVDNESKSAGEKTWNGHSYTFDEIKSMGKSAGKTDAEIKTLWASLK